MIAEAYCTLVGRSPTQCKFKHYKNTGKTEATMAVAEILNRAGELPLTTVILIAASSLFVALIIEQFRSWRRLRHVPGPFLNGFSILPWLGMSIRHDTAWRQLKLGRKYGI